MPLLILDNNCVLKFLGPTLNVDIVLSICLQSDLPPTGPSEKTGIPAQRNCQVGKQVWSGLSLEATSNRKYGKKEWNRTYVHHQFFTRLYAQFLLPFLFLCVQSCLSTFLCFFWAEPRGFGIIFCIYPKGTLDGLKFSLMSKFCLGSVMTDAIAASEIISCSIFLCFQVGIIVFDDLWLIFFLCFRFQLCLISFFHAAFHPPKLVWLFFPCRIHFISFAFKLNHCVFLI